MTPCPLLRRLPRLGLFAALALAATLPCTPAHAQFDGPPQDQADMPVTAAVRAATVESLAVAVERSYVFPDVANRTAAALRAKLKQGGYNGLDLATTFGDSLSNDLRAIGKDRHFRVGYWNRELAPDAFTDKGPSPDERSRDSLQARRLNHGFERLMRLSGNIGYLDLRAFDGSPEAGARAMATMTWLGDTDALIVDLRRNGGGDPNMITLLLSWLFPANERVRVNDFYFRDANRTEQYFTMTTIPGERYVNKDVYVLTSHRTGSAAEEFAYDIKNLKRGTLVGATTAGAANPGGIVRLGPHFAAFISNGRAVNPITKTNWEGVGVEPDVKTDAEEALKTAHLAALAKIIANEQDPDRKRSLERTVQTVKDTPVEPLDLGGRRPAAAPSK